MTSDIFSSQLCYQKVKNINILTKNILVVCIETKHKEIECIIHIQHYL